MKLIEVRGAYYEMGYQQGSEMKESVYKTIEEMQYNEFFENEKIARRLKKIIFLILRLYARVNLGIRLKKVYPHHYERLEGLVAGSKANKNWILLIHLFELLYADIRFYVNIPKAACTGIIIKKDDGILIGKNYDYPYLLKKHQIIRKSYPKGKYASISLTQTAIIGNHNGMNEHGLCITYTYLLPRKDYTAFAIPLSILIEEALENCKTIDEAIEFFKYSKRGNGATLGLADAAGNFCVVELSKSYINVRKPTNNYLVHTNHYVSEELKNIDIPDNATYKLNHPEIKGRLVKESSLKRFSRATELINKEKNIDEEKLMNIFRDHENDFPSEWTICRHGPLYGTLSSIFFLPHKKVLYVAEGHPCQAEYQKFEL